MVICEVPIEKAVCVERKNLGLAGIKDSQKRISSSEF